MKFQQVKEISDCITQQYISNLNFLQGNVDTLSYFYLLYVILNTKDSCRFYFCSL